MITKPWTVALAVGGGLAVLGGIFTLNKLARDDLHRRGYYTITIADLDVPAPPGLTRQQFLDEVCYEGRLPATLDRTDRGAAERLRAAFALHPWVESADSGDLAGPTPLTLTFRQPTLLSGDRVIDRAGIALPIGTNADGLPVYRGPPQSTAAVAKTVDWLKQQAPELKWRSAEVTTEGLILTRTDGPKAFWGFSRPSEPPATQKLLRLKEWTGGPLDLRK